MTLIGNDASKSRSKSYLPRSHITSISVSHNAAIDSSQSRTCLRIKLTLTNLRRNRCVIVHVDHHRHSRLIVPDATYIREQLKLPFGVDHRLAC